jgi:hypothetical protein
MRSSAPASVPGLSASVATRAPILLLGAFVALLQVAMFNRDFTVDGLAYATAVESGTDLLHANHLVFAVLHFALWQGAQWIGVAPDRAIWLMQGATAACAVATAMAAAGYLAPRTGAMRAALLGALLAGSFAFWNFAQEPEAYLPPLFCVALSLYLLRDPARIPGAGRIISLVALAVVAVLLLQQYVLWYPALLLLLADRLRAGPNRARALGLVAGIVPLCCLVVYLASAAWLGRLDDAASLMQWMLGYGFDPEQGIATYRAPPALPERFAGLLLGLGNLLFAYEVALDRTVLVVASCVGLGALLLLVPAWREAFLQRQQIGDVAALMVFGGGCLVFAFWWESRNIEFLLPIGFAAVLLAGLGAHRLHPIALSVIVVCVVSINALTAFWPQREAPARYASILALHEREALTAEDRVIVEELNTLRWLRYFHGGDAGFLSGAVSAAMHGEQALGDARAQLLKALAEGRRVYSTEIDEHGRLRALAERFAILGRAGYAGEVESDVDRLYDGLELSPVAGAPGVRRVDTQAPQP